METNLQDRQNNVLQIQDHPNHQSVTQLKKNLQDARQNLRVHPTLSSKQDLESTNKAFQIESTKVMPLPQPMNQIYTPALAQEQNYYNVKKRDIVHIIPENNTSIQYA